eukprot:superscaffoldBa00004679_g19289
MFQIVDDQKPFTCRGVLLTVNSLYNPLGFLTPISVHGRLILRELTTQAEDWDLRPPKDRWRESLQDLRELQVLLPHTSFSTKGAQRRELCVFTDVSVKVIAAVAYIKVMSHKEQTEIGFVFGKVKMAPQPGLTIQRLELCVAVLRVELAELIVTEMDVTFDSIVFYTDSKVVLGHLLNQSGRFYVYVHNTVQCIRLSSHPSQWKYIHSNLKSANTKSRDGVTSPPTQHNSAHRTMLK